MISEGEVSEGLSQFVGKRITAAFTGKVTNIEEAETKGIVVVTYNKMTYDVKLKSIIDEDNKHLLPIPKEGSMIFCVSEGNSQERFIALAFNELDKIIYNGENMNLLIDDVNKKFEVFIGETSVAMSEESIVVNGGENGGLAIVPELVTQLGKLSARVDGIIDAIKNATAIPQDGGVGLQSTMKISLATLVNIEDFSNIENEKVKH